MLMCFKNIQQIIAISL